MTRGLSHTNARLCSLPLMLSVLMNQQLQISQVLGILHNGDTMNNNDDFVSSVINGGYLRRLSSQYDDYDDGEEGNNIKGSELCYVDDAVMIEDAVRCVLDNLKRNGGVSSAASSCLCKIENFCDSNRGIAHCTQPLFTLSYFEDYCKSDGSSGSGSDISSAPLHCQVSFQVLTYDCCQDLIGNGDGEAEDDGEYEKTSLNTSQSPTAAPIATKTPTKPDGDDHAATLRPSKHTPTKTDQPTPQNPDTGVSPPPSGFPASDDEDVDVDSPETNKGEEVLAIAVVVTMMCSFLLFGVFTALSKRMRLFKNGTDFGGRGRRSRGRRSQGSVVTAEPVSDLRSDHGGSMRTNTIDDLDSVASDETDQQHHTRSRRGIFNGRRSNTHDDDDDDDDDNDIPPHPELMLIAGICEGAENQVIAQMSEAHKELLMKNVSAEVALSSTPISSARGSSTMMRTGRRRTKEKSTRPSAPSESAVPIAARFGNSVAVGGSSSLHSVAASAPSLSDISEGTNESCEVTVDDPSAPPSAPEEPMSLPAPAVVTAPPPLPPPLNTSLENNQTGYQVLRKQKGIVALFVIAEELCKLNPEEAPAIELILRRVDTLTSARDVLIGLQCVCGMAAVTEVANRMKAQGWTEEQMTTAQKRLKEKYIIAVSNQQGTQIAVPNQSQQAMVVSPPTPSVPIAATPTATAQLSEEEVNSLPLAPAHKIAANRQPVAESNAEEHGRERVAELALV